MRAHPRTSVPRRPALRRGDAGEENEEEYDGEAEDTVAELPPPRPKPSLDTASVSKDGSNASGQQSTARRWSVKAMFTHALNARGVDSHRAAAGSPQKLNAVVDAMKNISGKTAEEVLGVAGLMLQHCATHEDCRCRESGRAQRDTRMP